MTVQKPETELDKLYRIFHVIGQNYNFLWAIPLVWSGVTANPVLAKQVYNQVKRIVQNG